MAGRYAFTAEWSIYANYTWTDSEQKSGSQAGLPLTNTAEHMANVNITWDINADLNVYLQGEFRSDRYRGYDSVLERELYFKNYSLLNLGARWTLNDYVVVNLRINNLLDRDFTTYSVTYDDLNNDGQFEYLTGRGVTSEVNFTDDYNVKDKARNLWAGVTVSF